MEHQFISYLPRNESVQFIGKDLSKPFKKNLKTQPSDWVYRNKEITYSYNEQGFRTKPFDDINWKESVVIFGCSNVEGVGLAEEDTIAMQLEKIIERPVINLGVGGTGIDLACWNSFTLYKNYPTPKAIIQVWSSLDRYADYNRNGLLTFGAWGGNHRLNWEFRSAKYIETDRALWKNKTIYTEASFFGTTVKQMQIQELKFIDHARDLVHPGIESNRIAAEHFAEQLKSQI